MTQLMAIARSRTEPASRVERARILLAYRDDPSFFAVGRLLGVHHQTVQRCVERAAGCGALAALDDNPRPGKKPAITAEAKQRGNGASRRPQPPRPGSSPLADANDHARMDRTKLRGPRTSFEGHSIQER